MMKFIRSFPLIVAKIWCPFSSSTLKKAFGNNLNIGYLNTLSNTEEEKFITIINKYNFEEEKSNSKLNEKIKELVKDIPINYRLYRILCKD